MLTRRTIVSVTASAGLMLGVAGPTSAADPAYPTGTFRLDRTSTFLFYNPIDDSDPYASVTVSRSDLHDDATSAADLVTEVDPGDGRGPHRWSCSADACTISWTSTGTFTPQARLTDEDGHTTIYTLPQVTVLPDHTAPTARLTQPRHQLRHRKAGWRVIRGHASDSGIGLNFVKVIVLQKRHGWWYFYKPYQHTWRKGLRTEAATNRKFGPPGGDAALLPGHAWRSPRTIGLTRGPIVVRVWAEDLNGNDFGAKVLARGRITRR
jgi:hypothetical protein